MLDGILEKEQLKDEVDYFKKGITRYNNIEDDIDHLKSVEDFCVIDGTEEDEVDIWAQESNSLMEYYCADEKMNKEIVNCQYGCSSGKCNYEPDNGDYEGCSLGEKRCSPTNNAYDTCEYYNNENMWLLTEFCSDGDICSTHLSPSHTHS